MIDTSNWIELQEKSTGRKILLRADSINGVQEFDGKDAYSRETIESAIVSGNGYRVHVKETYYDILSLMVEKGELIIKT